MTVFERIKVLADDQHKSLRTAAGDLGFSSNLFYRWKETSPKAADLKKVADYFHVTLDYLVAGEGEPVHLKVDMKEIATGDKWDEWLSVGGKPLSDRDKILLKVLFSDQRIQYPWKSK